MVVSYILGAMCSQMLIQPFLERYQGTSRQCVSNQSFEKDDIGGCKEREDAAIYRALS